MSKHHTYHYATRLRWYANENRKHMNETERLVRHCILKWGKVWKKRVRQKPIDKFILDFYCASSKLCIEIDGDSHELKGTYDMLRDDYLFEKYGIVTLRFTDRQVQKNLQWVYDAIIARCAEK